GNALAARIGLSDSTGVAVRGEYVTIDGGIDLFSITGTVDHALTDGLTLRAEVRYDDSDAGDIFMNSSGNVNKDNQVLLLAEMIYEF
ncbi:MAG: outer membrane beta-barrel protein, partial [Myxococcota bacterium]